MDAHLATGAVTNPRMAALLQPSMFTTVERQATMFAPQTWNMVMRIEPKVGILDLGFKVNDNIYQPFNGQK